MAGLSRRRGRHRAPSRRSLLLRSASSTSAARRSAGLGRAALPAVLLSVMGSSLLAVGTDSLVPPAAAAPVAAPEVVPGHVLLLVRADRDRPVPARPVVVAAAPPAAGPPAPEPAAPEPPVPVLPDCTGDGSEAAGHANGRLPADALCLIGHEHHALRADAARALARLDLAARRDRGEPLCIVSSYRSYEQQVAVRRLKGRMAAVPGTSTHGLGTAVDFGCRTSFGSPLHAWLTANAPAHGWDQPAWARGDGALPEPWHWEYLPG